MTIFLAAAMNGYVDEGHEAVRELLTTLGEDPRRQGLVDTPRRVVEAWKELTSCSQETPENVVGNGVFELETTDAQAGLVSLREIPFACVSVDTLMPFHGNCHVAYKIAQKKILGLSKVARIVRSASKRIQSQQQLTDMVAEAILKVTGSKEVAVFVTATHIYYDRPLASVKTSRLTGKFTTSKQEIQDLQLVLQLDDASESDLQIEGCRHSLQSDPLVERVRHSLSSLFGRMRCTLPNQTSVYEYSRQMYWATVGSRDAFAPSVQTMQEPDSSDEENDRSSRTSVVSCVVEFVSTCEHHLLPFHGQVFIGCCTRDPVAARCCLSRSIRPGIASIASRLQVQEQLTNQIADHAMSALNTDSLLVICEAVHLCMIARGPGTHHTVTRTMCKRGEISKELRDNGIAALRRTSTH